MNAEEKVSEPEPLNMDELIVADLLFLGYSRTKIGKKLDMTFKVVNAHCLSMNQKMGCKTTKELLDKGSSFVLGTGKKGKNEE